MEIKKIETKYLVSDGKYTISVVVDEESKRLNIFRQTFFNDDFKFRRSKPEIIVAIAKLLIEATKIVKK